MKWNEAVSEQMTEFSFRFVDNFFEFSRGYDERKGGSGNMSLKNQTTPPNHTNVLNPKQTFKRVPARHRILASFKLSSLIN